MSGIIKANAQLPERSSVGAVAFNFDDMTGKAHAYLQQVKAEAAQIIVKAQQDAALLRKQAQEQGSKAAHDTAEKSVHARVDAQVRQQMQTALPALDQITQALLAARLEWMQKWETNALQLALAVAEKIVRRELIKQPEITLAWVREALELAAGSQSIKLYLNPEDHRALGKEVTAIAQQLDRLATTEIHPSEQISPGGCLIQTEYGSIDQRLESQLARIAEELS
ncbi:MAG TPA: FliH/SctL family protein [Pirellulaceae bacterium]|nr:FliH/SctL family protein [Pirellulaceae bacterium]